MKCPECHFDNPEDTRFCGNCATPLVPSEEIPLTKTETLRTPIIELTRGSTFAKRYEVIEELGRGGMGRVYRVFDKKIEEEVALKLLKAEIAADEDTIKRFSNELKFARKIAHKNVCRMYDLSEEEGTHYITMEYVSGEDLKSFIRRSGQLTIGKSLSIAKQVCEGLAEAHRLSVVHRDLKPQNIMIDREGNARIMDFGIARSLEAKGITEAGVMIGTPHYMSPEQVEGREADQRSDLYSLGVILYEMVTGRVPFEGDTPLSIVIKHKTEVPPDPREVNAQIPEDLSRLILRCMEKDKGKRYQGAEGLLSELSKIEKGIPTTEKVIPERKPEAEIVSEIKWENSIAVLPLTDMSPQRNQKYFCDGMTEEIINALTKLEGLRVASLTAAFQFKEKDYNIREIGEELKVQTVLQGSVRKVGNRLRISIQLINVHDGYPLWSDRYDREMDDVFAIQDEISLAIVDNLKVKLLGGERAKLVRRYTKNLEALDLYLKGRYCWKRRTEENLKKAIEYFQQAVEKDPTYALAYAGIADCHNNLGWYDLLPPKEAYPRARAAAEKALEMDETLSEAHASLANVIENYDWDLPAAEREYKRAIKLNPGYATAHHWYALCLAEMGRHDEAMAEAERAQKLDPLSLIISTPLGSTFYHARQYDRAIEEGQKTLEMDPTFIPAHWLLGLAYAQKRMYKKAIAEEQMAIDLSAGSSSIFAACLGNIYSLSGKRGEAKRILDELHKLSKQRYVSPYGIALIYVGLGEKDQAFEWLDKAYDKRDHWLVWLKVEPLLDSLRSEPRFTALLKKMNLE